MLSEATWLVNTLMSQEEWHTSSTGEGTKLLVAPPRLLLIWLFPICILCNHKKSELLNSVSSSHELSSPQICSLLVRRWTPVQLMSQGGAVLLGARTTVGSALTMVGSARIELQFTSRAWDQNFIKGHYQESQKTTHRMRQVSVNHRFEKDLIARKCKKLLQLKQRN